MEVWALEAYGAANILQNYLHLNQMISSVVQRLMKPSLKAIIFQELVYRNHSMYWYMSYAA
jgi:DNA-directed RNA polymerase beta subunit